MKSDLAPIFWDEISGYSASVERTLLLAAFDERKEKFRLSKHYSRSAYFDTGRLISFPSMGSYRSFPPNLK